MGMFNMNKGMIYALLAAMLNASVGLFSLQVLELGVSPESIAFYKCLFSFCVLSVVLFLFPKQLKKCIILSTHAHKIALLAFLGVYVLYYFETISYQFNTIALTVFILQGSSTVSSFLGTQFILKNKLNNLEWLSMFLAISGLMLLSCFAGDAFKINYNLLFAALSGVGYGLYLVLNKKISLPLSGIAQLWWLFLFGSLFLFVPFFHSSHLEFPKSACWIYIVCLSIFSTIGGFYFTNRALLLTSPSKTQLYELTEPIFASILAYIFFKQLLTSRDVVGSLLIIVSIYLLNRVTRVPSVIVREK